MRALLLTVLFLTACGSNYQPPRIDPIEVAIASARAIAGGAQLILLIKTCALGTKPDINNICIEQKVKDGINKGLPILEAGIAAAQSYVGSTDPSALSKVQDLLDKAIADYTKAQTAS